MKSLHRATTTAAAKKVPRPSSAHGGGAGAPPRRLRYLLLAVTLIGLTVFVATQFINFETHSDDKYGRGGAASQQKKGVHHNDNNFRDKNAIPVDGGHAPAAGGGAAVDQHNPYDKVVVATLDGNIANKEHADNVAAAGGDNHQQQHDAVGQKELAVKMQEIHERDKEVEKALMGGGKNAGRGLTCPAIDLEAFERELQIPLKHLPRKKKTSVGQKYDRRAHNCAGDGIWNRVTIKDHHAILQNIARLARIQHGSFVFDWGSGCGHQLEFLTKEFECSGVGVDVSPKTIAYATANTSKANLHCVGDGTKLQWIPSGHFDHAYSFGSIYHVYNRSKFCSVLRQMVRIVKPGGTVYNGWTENAEYRREHVGMCLADLPVKFTIYEEAVEFKDVQIFPLKASQQTPNTYSLVITKLKDYYREIYDAPELYSFEKLPVECGVHKCELKEGVVKYGDAAAAIGGGADAAEAQRAAKEHGPERPPTLVAGTPEKGEEVAAAKAEGGDGNRKDDAAPAENVEKRVPEGTGAAANMNKYAGKTWSFDGWPSCPAYDARMEELQIPLEHLPRKKKTSVGQKYDRRAHNCATTGVWHKVGIEDHKAILSTVGKAIEIKKDDVVFDWGCGCGHQLEFMYENYGARGLGIDVSNLTIAYAVGNTVPANRFCVADGTRLDWLPDNYFDKAFSFGSIYHVYDKRKFCSVLRQMVRIVKPGGIVYNGWTENSEFHRDLIVKCVNTADDSWMVERDREMYASIDAASADVSRTTAPVSSTEHHLDVDPDAPEKKADGDAAVAAPTIAASATTRDAAAGVPVREAHQKEGVVVKPVVGDKPFAMQETVGHIASSVSVDAAFKDGDIAANAGGAAAGGAKKASATPTAVEAAEKDAAPVAADDSGSNKEEVPNPSAAEALLKPVVGDRPKGVRNRGAAEGLAVRPVVGDRPFAMQETIGHIASSVSVDAAFEDGHLTQGSGRRLQADVAQHDDGDGAGSDHIVEIIPEKDLFAAVEVFPLKAKRTTRSTYSVIIRKAQK